MTGRPLPGRESPLPSPVPWDGDEPCAPLGVPLVDLLDRVLATGVVVSGDLVLSIADVPLVRVSLHALLSSVGERVPAPWADSGPL
ncbi:gas vesicle protein [Streptomyces sp. NPDC014776]|uniref:gas vesicle protein n=1 Tax=unclassified Streptomyces TaxID=2593676 RepID=UPI00367F20E5